MHRMCLAALLCRDRRGIHTFLQQLLGGITIGSTYALVAIGFTLVFGVLELTNFANGSLYILGAYLSLVMYGITENRFVLVSLLSIGLTATAGYCLDRLGLRRLREKKAPRMAGLITTSGMPTMIDNAIMIWSGSETKPLPMPCEFRKIEFRGTVISWLQILILSVSLILMGTLTLIVYKTKIGKATRVTAQNIEATKLMGININGVISFTFIISGILASIAGTLVEMYYQTMDVNMGTSVGTKIFASAILGGVGVLPGTMFGGLSTGTIETLAAGYVSSGYRDAIAFTVLIVVLPFKPSELFGKQQINKV